MRTQSADLIERIVKEARVIDAGRRVREYSPFDAPERALKREEALQTVFNRLSLPMSHGLPSRYRWALNERGGVKLRKNR